MLTLTRKLEQAILFAKKGTSIRLRFTVIAFRHDEITIRWNGERVGPPVQAIRVGRPMSFLFCGLRCEVHVAKVAAGLCRLRFDAPRDIVIDRAERVENNRSQEKQGNR